jgi:phosphopantothenoylcysteine decarboxylase / phosphopantothenate---cysteine ligase
MKNKTIIIGVCGGIACYKSLILIRLLIKQGANVHVVMTPNATQFISPISFQALSNNHVWVHEWDSSATNNMAHINLSRQIDAIILAPATANTIAKVAYGIADNLLCSMLLARPKNCPVFIAPAMNVEMWHNAATQRNIQQLKQDGLHILVPQEGEQACGEQGMGRMQEPEDIIPHLTYYFTPKILSDKHIVITAGATQEPIDPVRYISNASSGKMAYAIAQQALYMGAKVTLIQAYVQPCLKLYDVHNQLCIHNVQTAQQMYDATLDIYLKNIDANIAANCYSSGSGVVNKYKDVFIGVAAVADYTPKYTQAQKIKKNSGNQETRMNHIECIETQDILASVAKLNPRPLCIGFAAETENLIVHAQQKIKQKNIDLIIANLMQDAFTKNDNKVFFITSNTIEDIPRMSKTELADLLLQKISLL